MKLPKEFFDHIGLPDPDKVSARRLFNKKSPGSGEHSNAKKQKMFGEIVEEYLEELSEHGDKEIFTDKQYSHFTKKKRKEKKIPFKFDLHGLNMEEALERCEQALIDAKRGNMDKILFIHGQGIHSKDGPVLKKEVIRYLKQQKSVEQCLPSPPMWGGEGALLVYLK